jgi:hypothetical protein
MKNGECRTPNGYLRKWTFETAKRKSETHSDQ